MKKQNPRFRADVVGSFLRPPELAKARAAHERDAKMGVAKPQSLTDIEDESIRDLVKLQEQLGFEVASDGEFRRSFYFDPIARLDGVKFVYEEGYNFVGGFSPPRAKFFSKLRRPSGGMVLSEFEFLKSVTSAVPKITLPSPLFSQFNNKDRIDRTVYPDLDEFWNDIVTAYREELQALSAAGCTYVQIDETTLIRLCDPKFAGSLREQGIDPDAELDKWVGVLDRVTQDSPADLTLAMHICRGNGPGGSWISSGGYEPIADAIFNRIGIHTYLLEFDTDRAGGFEPLRFLPKGKAVVLGLLSTKSPQLEREEDIFRKVEEAARFVPFESLGLSPQCGFSSDTINRPLDFAAQKQKLELVVNMANRIWN